ncbi:MAG: epoxyqueuosine reductase [Bacteroidetes bacterium]|nr:epoxyqueuosine reductase [Bacteroidota bacterium]
MNLELELRAIAQKYNIDHFGIADLIVAHGFIESQGGPQVIQYPKAISIGLTLFHDIIDQLPNRKTRSVSIAYKHHCYDIINNRLDLIVSEMSSYLQRLGFRVMPIPASKRIDDKKLSGVFSHKLAANLSGLGWIGKSCLLITPSDGPRVRFATILTNAPLESTGTANDNKCGECEECVTICPPKAFSGRPFNSNEEREIRYDAHKCDQYFKSMRKTNDWATCGMCVYICPYGRNSK